MRWPGPVPGFRRRPRRHAIIRASHRDARARFSNREDSLAASSFRNRPARPAGGHEHRRTLSRGGCLLAASWLAAIAPAAAAGHADGSPPRPIDLHAGIPGVAYIGQPLKELLGKFPAARVTPFAGQDDAVTVQIPELGISCVATGLKPDDLVVATAGFNLEGNYEGVSECGCRTREGIGKGSTVNDLLGTYGAPREIVGPRGGNPLLKRRPEPEDPHAPKRYQYGSPDGRRTTSFVVQDARVLRIVVYDLAPIDRHLLKRRPAAAPQGTPAP